MSIKYETALLTFKLHKDAFAHIFNVEFVRVFVLLLNVKICFAM